MKNVQKIVLFILCILLVIAPFNNSSVAISNDKPVYYVLDKENNGFVEKSSYNATPSISLPGTYETFYVDGVKNKLKIISATLNEEETNSLPYTGLQRIKSIANGQTSTTTQSNIHQKTVGTSSVKKKNSSFSFGLGITSNDKMASTIQKVLKSFTSFSFSADFSFDKTYSTSNTNTKINKTESEYTKTYKVPNLPQFEGCNSADFYTFTNYYVYDIVAEIIVDGATSDKNFGYTSVINTYKTKQPYDGVYRCACCNKILNGCDMFLPFLEEYPEEDNDIVHVVLANGRTGHCGRNLWNLMVDEGYYKPYNPDCNTIVEYKFYWPVVEGVVMPWTIDGPNEFNLNKPVHLVPSGMEEIIYDNNQYYKLVIQESPLTNVYHSISLPGEQVGEPVLPGLEQTISISKEIAVSSTTERTTVKNKSKSLSLVAKFKNWLSLSSGYKRSTQYIDSSSVNTTDVESISETNKYVLPSWFTDNGYEGNRIHVTKDSMLYEITGEIIPINSNGTLDIANEGIITYTQKKEFPRVYANPFDVAP
ncbi:hypothetical protein [Abyssisolibacter fermentans]|uniref:hypothetical protein n=1 Tax=Abyssisolibacter fermentans TaxID=1766203 RepID=UPI00082F0785|nr:hypothetical protein [Abyssisolibacter fermentans]